MAITSKGSKWERSESSYIIIAFIPLINWIAFSYVGLTSNTKRWIYWSIFYSTPLIMLIYVIIFSSNFLNNSLFLDRYCNLIQIMTIVHAFLIRKEYLIRLEATREGKRLTKDEVKIIMKKNKLVNPSKIEYTSENKEQAVVNKNVVFNNDVNKPQSENKNETMSSIDINTASENELAALPGIGLILAKKAVNHRETKGYFNSVDEFAEILSLKPHVLQRVKPLITVSKIENKTDESSNKSGRIVDF
ncbi:ComEA family DNA-binding protein [Clostridium drakei]|nr:helix-hairpin-helix domain-containing protein [Clostridium drakei]